MDDWYRASFVRAVDGGSTKYQQPAQVEDTEMGNGRDLETTPADKYTLTRNSAVELRRRWLSDV